ncbi:PREDICTED: uncharacterized protein LOC106123848 [Papilio xuthus]|uniref:Uncharacterized protein LOC106123848 n=1 Tax=Papilio xuthus TaxID=66420 RepID=A0AAJ7EFQ9_PAPXU|nr:PREDICTED: uncharacterized protein LOC106123848 [Papilio xuthus]
MVRLIAILCLQAYFLTEAFGIPVGIPGAGCANALPTMLPGPAIEAYSMATPFINNIQVTPTISELVPSLQYGDMTMGGDLPIGGTIKVCGCFPVYGMIAVDGALPSAGTAVVDDLFGRQSFEVRCGGPYF